MTIDVLSTDRIPMSQKERVPEHKFDWQAHPKSHTIGWNANHLAEILGWIDGMLTMPSWDFAPIGGELYQSPKLTIVRRSSIYLIRMSPQPGRRLR